MLHTPSQRDQVQSDELLADDGGEGLRNLEERLIRIRQEMGFDSRSRQAAGDHSVAAEILAGVFDDAEEILVKARIFKRNM